MNRTQDRGRQGGEKRGASARVSTLKIKIKKKYEAVILQAPTLCCELNLTGLLRIQSTYT